MSFSYLDLRMQYTGKIDLEESMRRTLIHFLCLSFEQLSETIMTRGEMTSMLKKCLLLDINGHIDIVDPDCDEDNYSDKSPYDVNI